LPTKFLNPLDQLHSLNSELYPVLNQFNGNLLVVGGQSVAYWLDYYKNIIELSDANMQAAQSVDIDYATYKDDVQCMAECWEVEADFAENEASCSIAVMGLKDSEENIKEDSAGAMFIDIDALKYASEVKCNIVDIIDLPAGFAYTLLSAKKDLNLYTTPFVFRPEYSLQPNNKLRILSPLGCMKSRIANLLHTQKDKSIELARIKALREPLALHMQDICAEAGFKEFKLLLDALKELILSPDGIHLYIYHDINLIVVYKFIATATPSIPTQFTERELPRSLAQMKEKYERRKIANVKHKKIVEEKAQITSKVVASKSLTDETT